MTDTNHAATADNDELKKVAKKALRLGLELGVPVAKKVLSSETGQIMITVAADMAQDILSSAHEKTKEEKTPKRAWNEADIAPQVRDEAIEKIKKEFPDMYKELIKIPTRKR